MAEAGRRVPLEAATGPANMAADERLLEDAIQGCASLRFYTWSEPTLSLGYFQPATERLPGLPWVRRASGGAALVHDKELTYCLALPAGAPWQRPGESWICRFHTIISKALAKFGIRDGVTCVTAQKLGPVLCFLHHTPGDLVLAGHKIGGSAQRKQRGALMQHGGILLARSPHTPHLPGLRDLTGIDIAPTALADAITDEFVNETKWVLVRGDWTVGDRKRIAELSKWKYQSDGWNFKR
jgi:lipoate-protein ligase A